MLKLRLKLVDDWRHCWRWLSVHFIAVSAALQIALLAMPADIRSYLPERLTQAVATALLVAAFMGRITAQPIVERKDDPVSKQP